LEVAEQSATTAGVAEVWPMRGRHFMALLLAVVAAAYFGVFLFVRYFPAYDRKVGGLYGPALDYGFSVRHADADVVVFGDSSALFGFSPAETGQALGVSVINLPNTYGSLPVTRDDALQSYLRNNKPPRLIVFYMAAWELDFMQGSNPHLFEGEDMLVRHGSMSEIASYLAAHPESLLKFPFRFYMTVPKSSLSSKLRHRDFGAVVATTHGHLDYERRDAGLLGPACRIPGDFMSATRTASVEDMLRKYDTASTRTMVYLAPMPSCSGSAALSERSYLGGTVAPPKIMPAGYFGADGSYAHLQPEAVDQSTQFLVDALRPMLAGR
jgi:hypothetical protein